MVVISTTHFLYTNAEALIQQHKRCHPLICLRYKRARYSPHQQAGTPPPFNLYLFKLHIRNNILIFCGIVMVYTLTGKTFQTSNPPMLSSSYFLSENSFQINQHISDSRLQGIVTHFFRTGGLDPQIPSPI